MVPLMSNVAVLITGKLAEMERNLEAVQTSDGMTAISYDIETEREERKKAVG